MIQDAVKPQEKGIDIGNQIKGKKLDFYNMQLSNEEKIIHEDQMAQEVTKVASPNRQRLAKMSLSM